MASPLCLIGSELCIIILWKNEEEKQDWAPRIEPQVKIISVLIMLHEKPGCQELLGSVHDLFFYSRLANAFLVYFFWNLFKNK
jgi:hypothetical protein